MKKTIKFFAVAAALTLCASVFAACGSSDNKAGGGASSAASAAASGAESSAAESKAAASADLSNPEITIADGDYDAMESFAKELQSGQNEGKVVKITGINSRSNFGAKASIMESNGDGKKIGTTYIITGADSIDAYPAEDATIEITGVVTKSDNGISCQIEVAPENVVTK